VYIKPCFSVSKYC